MPTTHEPPDEKRQRSIEAVATFSALMHAYERGELTTAVEAQTELERLGVRVRFIRPTRPGKAVINE